MLLPGLVDTHVHVNEPGRTDWEGFATATRAAAAGGITTIVDMPLNSMPPTTNAASLRVKREDAAGQAHVDVGFWGGAVPGSSPFCPRCTATGCSASRSSCRLRACRSSRRVDQAGLDAVMAQAAGLAAWCSCTPEDVRRDRGSAAPPAGRSYASFLASRPAAAEVAAIAQVIDAARRTGARAHILHLSRRTRCRCSRRPRRDGAAVTAETCPHYLALAAEDVPDGATAVQVRPPIRERANRERLWQALRDGIIDCVVSDHSPCPPAMKRLADRRLRRRLGRDLVGAAVAAGGVDPGARARLFA